jgi:hypothetical protein
MEKQRYALPTVFPFPISAAETGHGSGRPNHVRVDSKILFEQSSG